MRTAVVSGVIAAVVGVILLMGAGDIGGPNSLIVIGAISGAAYGMVALGLVLVYKGARVFNFAQAEFGTIAAFIAFVLVEQVRSVNIPYWIAIIVALAGVTLLGLIMERVLVRPLLNAPRVTVLVATIAFTLLLIAVELLLFLPEPKELPELISATNEVGEPVGPEIADYFVPPQQIILVFVLIALAPLLGWFFSKTDLGLAILATSQDAFATRVVGIGVERTSRFIWGASAFLGGAAGILLLGGSTLYPSVMTENTLIPALTAAVIGGMTSLPGAFIGGLSIGIVQALASWMSTNEAWMIGDNFIQDVVPAFDQVALVALLVIVLLIRPQGLLGTET